MITPCRLNRPRRAAAIGHGIARAIYAQAEDPQTAADWIHYCLNAAREAEQVARESIEPHQMGTAERLVRELWPDDEPPLPPAHEEHDEAAIREAAATAFRCCMPALTSRRRAQAYIACVAAGVQHRYISAGEARSLLYTAQLALAANPKRAPSAARRRN